MSTSMQGGEIQYKGEKAMQADSKRLRGAIRADEKPRKKGAG